MIIYNKISIYVSPQYFFINELMRFMFYNLYDNTIYITSIKNIVI